MSLKWPQKKCELQNHHMDSTRWNDFEFREGDIVIATWAKSGTTWMQQIVAKLLFGSGADVPIMSVCPWIERRGVPIEKVVAKLASQEHRRFLKTHLPVESLVFSEKARYVYVARDGRDALWSWYNHHQSYTDAVYKLFNETPGRVGPPLETPGLDIVEYFHTWLDRDGYPAWPFFSNILSWWEIRALPNVLLVHFNDLKADLKDSMRRIADFLQINVPEEEWQELTRHCSFEYMKENSDILMPELATSMKGGAKSLIYKGTNGRWRDTLTKSDLGKYELVASRNLPPECARWLANGTSI